MWFCGIDIGTTHLKVVGIDEEGKSHAPVKSRTPVVIENGLTFHHGEQIWTGVQDLIAQYGATEMASHGPLAAVSIATFGQEEALAVDALGQTVYPSLGWWQVRPCSYLPVAASEYLDSYEHYQISGLRHRGIQSPERMAYIRAEHPNAWKSTKYWVDFGSYALFKLTGQWVSASNQINHSQFFDVQTLAPHEPSLALLDLSAELFPPVAPSGSYVGVIDSAALPGVPLTSGAAAYIGGHDQVMGVYSQRGSTETAVFDSIGTSEYLMVLTEHYEVSKRCWELGVDIERGWGGSDYLFGYATPSGKILQTLAELFHRGDFEALLGSANAAPVANTDFRVNTSSFAGTGEGLLDLLAIPSEATGVSVSRSCLDHLAETTRATLKEMCALAHIDLVEVLLMGSLFHNASMVEHRRAMWQLPLTVSTLPEPVAVGAAQIAMESHLALIRKEN